MTRHKFNITKGINSIRYGPLPFILYHLIYEYASLRIELFDFRSRLEFQGVGITSNTTTNVSDISIHFMVRLPNEAKHLTLEKFEIRNIGGIDVDFNGQNFGFLNWIISRLSSSIINLIKGLLKGRIQGLVKQNLNPIIQEVPTDAVEIILSSFSGY